MQSMQSKTLRFFFYINAYTVPVGEYFLKLHIYSLSNAIRITALLISISLFIMTIYLSLLSLLSCYVVPHYAFNLEREKLY